MCRSRILVFNCSHEMALAANVRQYFPPKNIKQMEADLRLLPFWWAEDGDAIVVDDVDEARRFVESVGCGHPDVVFTTWTESYASLCKRTGREFVPCPWGWNKAVRGMFVRMGVDESLLPTNEEIDDLRSFASREFSVDYFKQLLSASCDSSCLQRLISVPPVFCRSVGEMTLSARQLIFKSPWSSSGRGVFAAEQPLGDAVVARLNGFVKLQGGFLADRFYDKLLDFAMEFYVRPDGDVDFVGFSVFDTGEGGRYGGNVVASQDCLRRIIMNAIGADSDCGNFLEWLAEQNKRCLSHMLGGRYSGVVGIDMLVVRDAGEVYVHPCIELNMRMNMGVLAIKLHERLAQGCGDVLQTETALTPERKCGFVAKCVDGRLMLTHKS